jgi:hypothetical protein
MHEQAGRGAPALQRHLQGIERQRTLQRVAHRPADCQ